MIKFAVYAVIKQEHRDAFLDALRDYLPAVREEEHTLQYDVCEADSSPGTFVFFEAYPDEQAKDAHTGSRAFKRYMEEIGPFLEKPPIALSLLESGA